MFSGILGSLAEAGAGERAWTPTLEAVIAMLHGSTATVFLHRPADGTLDWIDQCGAAAPGDAYTDYYCKQDVLFPAVNQRPPFHSATNSQLVDFSEFTRTEFYADFARPRDMLDCSHVRLFDAPDESVFFAVTRSHAAGVFDNDESALIDLLAPHLARAVRNSRYLNRFAGERDLAYAALASFRDAIMVVDVRLRLLHANPAAERILRSNDPLSCRDNKVTTRRPADADAFRRLVVQQIAPDLAPVLENPGSALALARRDGSPLLLRLLPLRPDHPGNPTNARAALIVAIDPDRREMLSLASCLRSLFHLTPVEARVAALVGSGEDPGAVAEALAMKRTTVRWYLQRVFEKTGTARQTHLVQLVERLSLAQAGK